MTKAKPASITRRIVGYCTRCGGDCYDDRERIYHRCPKVRPEAAAIVAIKDACDRFETVYNRRSWAHIVRKEDCAELIQAIDTLRQALSIAYPTEGQQ